MPPQPATPPIGRTTRRTRHPAILRPRTGPRRARWAPSMAWLRGVRSLTPPSPPTPNRATAGVLGALDGLAEGLEEYDVAEATDRAIAETTAVVAGVERGVHRSGWSKARRGRAPHPVSRPMRRARRAVRHAIER